MKLVNTKDIRNLLENGLADFGDFFDPKVNEAGPCREIMIDAEKGDIVLLVDHKEIMRQSLGILEFSAGSVPAGYVYGLMALWREGRMAELQAELRL
jgi:hypothetical protein